MSIFLMCIILRIHLSDLFLWRTTVQFPGLNEENILGGWELHDSVGWNKKKSKLDFYSHSPGPKPNINSQLPPHEHTYTLLIKFLFLAMMPRLPLTIPSSPHPSCPSPLIGTVALHYLISQGSRMNSLANHKVRPKSLGDHLLGWKRCLLCSMFFSS